MSIGEFARRPRLSPKALRLYDDLGLLPPARVDEDSGYRYYAASQLDRAWLIAALRQLQISLTEIKSIVSLEPGAAATQICNHWKAVEAEHTARRDLARYLVDHTQGAVFSIYWGEVSEDSDGPVEWCRPVPTDQAEQLAVGVPELVLRNEPAHREAFIHLGPGGRVEPAQWQLISQSLHGWLEDHTAQPSELGARITYLADPTPPAGQGPDCDFAIPIT